VLMRLNEQPNPTARAYPGGELAKRLRKPLTTRGKPVAQGRAAEFC
jgi:hypothetical protein